jgi:hypothetical protein
MTMHNGQRRLRARGTRRPAGGGAVAEKARGLSSSQSAGCVDVFADFKDSSFGFQVVMRQIVCKNPYEVYPRYIGIDRQAPPRQLRPVASLRRSTCRL